MTSKTPLNALIVEDVPENAERLIRRLELAGFALTGRRVVREDECLKEAQSSIQPDIIIAHEQLPDLDALRALRQLQSLRLDIPFLVVTEGSERERAATCIQAGAFDYLLEDRLEELGAAVSRALDERRLRESEELLRFAVENARDLILVLGADQRIRYASPALGRLLGYAEGETTGHPALDYVHPDDRARVAAAVERGSAEPGTTPEVATRFRHRDGSYRRFQARGSSHVTSRGQELGVINARDITERAESDKRLERTLSVALDAVIVSDAEGRVLDWNLQAEKTFGWSRTEILGRTLQSTIIPVDYREEHLAGLTQFHESGKGPILNRRIEVSARTKAGAEIPIELTVTPIRMGEEWIFSAFARDLSETKRAQKEMELLQIQLLQAQKMEAVGLLAGGVAHDFNNILTVILGQSQLLMNQKSLPSDLRHRVETISGAATRASSLTSQLLAFSRRQVLSPTALDLNEVVSHMHEMLERVIGEDIEIEILPGEDLGAIEADRSQIEQVILNLVVNARDAMPEGGKLTITTEAVVVDESRASMLEGCAPGRYISLRVHDRGLGMDASVMARIFEPFFTTKELGRGTGLGLSTVYGIVKQSGGSIQVSSEEGKGTTFEVLLPEVGAEPRKPDESLPGGGRGEGRVLIVEDDDSVRSLAQEILEIAGYETLSRSSAREALGVIERVEGSIDLVITDVVLKGMNGHELASLLSKRFPKIEVLFLSGYYDHPLVENHTHADGPAVVRKPFVPSDLTRAVSDAFERKSRKTSGTD